MTLLDIARGQQQEAATLLGHRFRPVPLVDEPTLREQLGIDLATPPPDALGAADSPWNHLRAKRCPVG